MATNDVKIALGAQTEKFRLLQDKGRKFWQVSSPESQIEADFTVNEASYGVGLLRHQEGRLGTTLRIADGYGVDLSEQGLVKNGPGAVSVGAYSGVMLQARAFNDRVMVLTTSNLYSTTGSTPSSKGSVSGAKNSTAMFQREMYIAAGNNGSGSGRYYQLDSWSGTLATKIIGTPTNVNFIASVHNKLIERFWLADANKLYSTADPDTPVDATLEITLADNITNMWSMNGYLFVTTEASIFIIHNNAEGDPEALELNSKLASRRNSTAFSISDSEGQEAWLSDGTSMFLLRALGFNEFDITPAGPFETTLAVPITSLTGTIIDVSIDASAVYVTTERISGQTHVYKGIEKERGLFVWSPLIHRNSGAVDAAQVVAHDGTPYLYLGDNGNLFRYQLRDWTNYTTSWEIETPFYNNNEPTIQAIYHRLLARLSATGGTIQAAARTTETGSYTNLGAAFDSDVARNMSNLTGKEIQLKFTMTGSDSAKYCHLRGFKTEGVRRPEKRDVYTFTIIPDNIREATFLKGLVTNASNAPIISRQEGFTTDVSVQVYPGWPREVELFDEVIGRPTRAFEIRAVEVLS